LKCGENDIPFWDDVKFSLRTRLAREALLVEVFENPQRFRFDIVGEDITNRYGKAISGRFSDEIDLSAPLEQFTSQCRATVERRIPTYYRHGFILVWMFLLRLMASAADRGRFGC
jgi:hypothetical protein